jgi:hypothetical protein
MRKFLMGGLAVALILIGAMFLAVGPHSSVAAPAGAVASARGGIVIKPKSDYVTVTVINHLGDDVRVRVIGFDSRAQWWDDFAKNDKIESKFYKGERVICVWNEKEDLIFVADCNFDKDGDLELDNSDPGQVAFKHPKLKIK